MRVWALASCGGLLALAACSGDQANTANPNTPPADGDALSQGKTSPSTTTPKPLAQPEAPLRQTRSTQPRLNLATVSGGADLAAPQPQANQLRARLQRLRNQQGTRLASTAPTVVAPIPTVVASSIPQPQAPTLRPAASNPGASGNLGDGRDSRLAIGPQPSRAGQSPLSVALPPLPSPQPTVTKTDLESSGTDADLQSVVAAGIASHYPIAPLRHQGQSTRPRTQSALPQVSVPSISQPVVASARLHGSTAPAPATQPRGDSPTPEAGAATTSIPALTPDSDALLARAPGATTISQGHVASQARTGNPLTLTRPRDFPVTSPGGAHRQGSAASLGSTERLPLQASLAPRPDSRTPGDQGLGAIALPESLPLHSAAPRPSASPSQPNVSPPAAVLPTAIPPAVSRSAITDRATTEPAADPFAAAVGGHLSPTDPVGLHLVPPSDQSPKGLPLAHCPSAIAHTPAANRLVEGAIAPQPSFSGHSQSMTPDKDALLAHCPSNAPTQSVALEPETAAAPAPDSLGFTAFEANDFEASELEATDLDLETLAPDPAFD